jgi:clan AA aspartic protease
MIRGKVNLHREAVVPLLLVTESGDPQRIDAVVDTGFNGWLTLPSHLISSLGLTWYTRSVGEMADGTLVENDVYLVEVLWNGQPRTVLATRIDSAPLIGMSLLAGHELRVQAIEDGDVTITPL